MTAKDLLNYDIEEEMRYNMILDWINICENIPLQDIKDIVSSINNEEKNSNISFVWFEQGIKKGYLDKHGFDFTLEHNNNKNHKGTALRRFLNEEWNRYVEQNETNPKTDVKVEDVSKIDESQNSRGL